MSNCFNSNHQKVRTGKIGISPITNKNVGYIILNGASNPSILRRIWCKAKNIISIARNRKPTPLPPNLYFDPDIDFAFFYPRPSLAFIQKYYGGKDKSEVTLEDRATTYSPSLSDAGNEILDWIESHFSDLRNKDKICGELGVGLGWLANAAIKRGYSWTGIDANVQITNYLKSELKINTINAMVQDLDCEFDLLTSVDTAEHFLNPLEDFRKIYTNIRPGGYFFVSVPNFNSVTARTNLDLHRYFAYPAHLNYFTEKSIRFTLESAKFVDVKVETRTFAWEIPYILEPYIKNNIFNWINSTFVDEMTKSGQGERLFALGRKR